MLHNNLLHDWQAQSGSVGLRGVEGYENLGEILQGDSWPIIDDRDALHFTAGHVFDGTTDLHAPAKRLPGSSFGGVTNEIQQRLAQKPFVPGDAFEFAARRDGHLGGGLAYFINYAVDHRPQRHLFCRKIQGPRKPQEFSHHVGQCSRLVHDQLRILRCLAFGLAAYHLGVARNGR